LSELIKWFERKRQTKAVKLIQQHLAITTAIAEDLEKAIKAALKGEIKKRDASVKRIAQGEQEADKLRRRIMDELSSGELLPVDREDLMHLTKRVDMIADWSREATRILTVLPLTEIPLELQRALIEMTENIKMCVFEVRKCINKMMKKASRRA